MWPDTWKLSNSKKNGVQSQIGHPGSNIFLCTVTFLGLKQHYSKIWHLYVLHCESYRPKCTASSLSIPAVTSPTASQNLAIVLQSKSELTLFASAKMEWRVTANPGLLCKWRLRSLCSHWLPCPHGLYIGTITSVRCPRHEYAMLLLLLYLCDFTSFLNDVNWQFEKQLLALNMLIYGLYVAMAVTHVF